MIGKLIVSFIAKSVKYKDTVFNQDDPAVNVFIVLEGEFEIIKKINDN